MQQIKVRVNQFFGDEEISLPIPDEWVVKETEMGCKDTPPMTNEEIRNALDNTIGSLNIVEQAQSKRGKIVITCDDLTRPTPIDRVFPFVIEQLHKAGISDNQIFILGAFGCHPPMNIDDFTRKIGEEAVAKYDCVNHNPFFNLENLGKTSWGRGTPVIVNKEFASADLRICISGVKKHPMAGAGGGPKSVLPGVSSMDTTYYNHEVIGAHIKATHGYSEWWIKDNPLHLDMLEAARIANLNISINCVYDGSRRIIGLTAGDVDDAWKVAVKDCYEAHATKPIKKADIVLVNAYPSESISWWGAQASLREGGTAVAIHQYQLGNQILHYRTELMDGPWLRMAGYPKRRWPVKQAENIIVYTKRLSKRHMLSYSDKVEWKTEWDMVLSMLKEIHGKDALVVIYPCPSLQFDPESLPLLI